MDVYLLYNTNLPREPLPKNLPDFVLDGGGGGD